MTFCLKTPLPTKPLQDRHHRQPAPHQPPPKSALTPTPPVWRPTREQAPHPLSPPSYACEGIQGRETGEWKAQVFPLRTVGGPGNQVQYWPFSASDLYNWKTHNPPFSKGPLALTGLIESILLTHQPTWDDCQQLLQALLATEERQRVILEAKKSVPGPNGAPHPPPKRDRCSFPTDTTGLGLQHPCW